MKFMKASVCIILVLFLGSCNAVKQMPCENLICTKDFRSITVAFTDTNGEPLQVKNFKSINLRTNQTLTSSNINPISSIKGVYLVATDEDLKDLSYEGDRIKISATHPTNGALKEAEFVISGGICNCHVSKISGPEIITF